MTLIKNLNWIITRECNSACIHCDIWKCKNKESMSLEDTKKIVQLPLIKKSYQTYGRDLKVALGGGEPFLVPYLDFLVAHIEKELPGSLDTISTNGLDTARILNFLKKFSFLNIQFNISIDGIGPVHDQVRGLSGAFKKTAQTIRLIRWYFPQTSVKCKLTLIPQNYDQILDVYEFSKKWGCDFVFKPAEHLKNYTNTFSAPDLNFTKHQLQRIKQQAFVLADEMAQHGNLSKADFYQDIPFYLEGKKKPQTCSFLTDSVSLMPNGSCFACFKRPSLGHIDKDALHHPDRKRSHLLKPCNSCMLMCGAYKDYDQKKPRTETANIEITTACNLACDMCTQKGLKKIPQDMQQPTINKILKRYPDIRHISFLGGEPFLNGNFFSLMEVCDKKGITYEVTTNGTLLTRETIERLTAYTGLKKVTFSLDGMKTYHDRVRERGSFHKCLHALTDVMNYCCVSVSSVLRNDNRKEILSLARHLKKMGIRDHKIILGMNISPEERIKTFNHNPYLIIQGPSFKKALQNYDASLKFFMGELKEINTEATFEPSLFQALPKTFLTSGSNSHLHILTCRQLKQYRFDVKGDRIICEFIRNRYDEHIVSKLKDNLLPICARCCKLEKKTSAPNKKLKKTEVYDAY